MFRYWNDTDRTFDVFDELRRRMDRAFDEVSVPRAQSAGFPRMSLHDTGSGFVVEAELPGVSDRDVEIGLDQNVLTISGERKTTTPEGYTVHRQERPQLRFSRSLSFPVRVDPEKCVASMKNGMLTVQLSKAAEVQPRRITVKAG